MVSLEQLGFGPFFRQQFDALPHKDTLVAARVMADSGGYLALAGCQAPLGEVAGKLKETLRPSERPIAGDWVAALDDADRASVVHLLQRRTELRRRAAGSETRPQVVAANVDLFFVVTSANRDFNPRRIERYLAAVWDSGAHPAIVINKCDLVDDVAPLLEQLEVVAAGIEVLTVSAKADTELSVLLEKLEPGKTIGFVGSSGVGKSTLINRLVGDERHSTHGLRADDKGRHTTTRRELTLLDSGAILVDTPGMREFGVLSNEEGLAATFADILTLAEACRFGDCQHEVEPGCAVRAAADEGALSVDRLESYLRLRKETQATTRRNEPEHQSNSKRRWKSIHKQMRNFSKKNPNGR